MVAADKRDYKTGYRKHYSAYKDMDKRGGPVISKRLLLAYAVECGLKYKLLDSWAVNSLEEIKEILQDRNHPKHNVLGSHNLQKMIKELGQEGNFDFPPLMTIHKDSISVEEYHQMQRYGIKEDDKGKYKDNMIIFERVLKDVADWIEGM